VNRVHAALGGLTELDAILERTVKEVGSHSTSTSAPCSSAPRRAARGLDLPLEGGLHGRPRQNEIPRALLDLLSAEGSYVLLPDVAADEKGSPTSRPPRR